MNYLPTFSKQSRDGKLRTANCASHVALCHKKNLQNELGQTVDKLRTNLN